MESFDPEQAQSLVDRLPIEPVDSREMHLYHSVEDARQEMAIHDLRERGYAFSILHRHGEAIGRGARNLNDEELATAEIDAFFQQQLLNRLTDAVRAERSRRER